MQLQLTHAEVEFIMNSLAQQPYIQVHELITKVQRQASAQLSPGNPVEAAAPAFEEQPN